MSIRISHSGFEKLTSPLGLKQPSGAMDKRQAASVDFAARRLLVRENFKLGGITGEFSRRGYENVIDEGCERVRLYCKLCGSMQKEKENNCRLCNLSFVDPIFIGLSCDKYLLNCISCDLPFYKKDKIQSAESEFKSAVGYRSDVCSCFVDLKKKRAETLRRDNNARKARKADEKKKFLLQNLELEILKLNEIKKTSSSSVERRNAQKKKAYLLSLLHKG